jgi:hypothetical protein
VLFLAYSYQEIIWFNVSVQEMTGVNELNSLQHLIGKHQDCLQTELSLAVV